MTAITLVDALAANKVLSYRRTGADGVVLFAGTDSVTSAGAMKLSIGISYATPARKSNHINVKIDKPTEHVVDGVTRVAYTDLCHIKVVLPETMTQGERDDTAAFLNSAIGNAVVQDAIKNLTPAA